MIEAIEDPSGRRPMRGLRERHLDLLLAEEIAVNPTFAWWVAEGALTHLLDGARQPFPLPQKPPASVASEVSYWDPSTHPEAAGETDVLVRLNWDDAPPVGLFVEDKLDAIFQPWQAERYAARAAAAEIPTATILVAPRRSSTEPPRQVFLGRRCRSRTLRRGCEGRPGALKPT